MHDDEDGAALQQRAQRVLGGGLGVDVDGRERVVEHEDPRAPDDGAGQGEPLALAAGEAQPLLADARVEAPGQVEGEAGLGHLQRGQHLLLGGVGLAHEQVLPHGSREQRGLLEREPDLATQAGDREVAQVVPVEGDAPLGGVVEAGEERDERRLAGAGGAHHGDDLARLDVEVDVGEHGPLAALVGERDALEADVAPGVLDGEGAGSVLDRRHGVEHLVDAHGRALGLAGQGHDPRQDLERERQHQHVGDERHQAAEGEAARADREHPGQQHDREDEVGDEREHPHEARVEADALHLGVVDLLGLGLVAGEGDVAAPEGLEHADALGALLDGGGEVAGLVLDAADDDHVAQLEAVAEHDDGDGGREGRAGRGATCSTRSTTKIATTCTRMRMKKMAPKPMNRRMTARSVMARDRSWPDCQRSWKPTSSRWSWA